jgi:aminodeoxychorismate lyase
MTFCYINGKFIKSENAKISLKDRGFRFGDGVFETIKFENSELKYFYKHFTRLCDGLSAINIKPPTTNHQLLTTITNLIQKNNLNTGFVRIMITRGQGSRGYLPTNETPPTIIIETMPERQMDLSNIRLCVSEYRKIPLECLPSNYKLMNGLNYTLAKQEARDKGFFDCVMLTIDGFISECSSSNVFWKKNGVFYTPSLDTGCLKGVMREVFMEENKGVIEGKFTLEEIKNADEIYISNVLIGFIKVKDLQKF